MNSELECNEKKNKIQAKKKEIKTLEERVEDDAYLTLE